jgi:hypothetical protein
VTGSICDGQGTCQILNYGCHNSELCMAGIGCQPCQTNSDCSNWGYCNTGTCAPKGQAGATCVPNSGDECLNGICSGSGTCP